MSEKFPSPTYYSNPFKGYQLDKAKSQIKDESEINMKYVPKPSNSDAAYYKQAYPENYGNELASRMKKIPVNNKTGSVFIPKAMGYFKLSKDELRKSDFFNDQEKKSMLRYAASAWEIRAETDEEGNERYYFVLRDDIEL